MSELILRRFLHSVPTVLGITIISFIIVLAAPGDPLTQIRFNPNSSPEATAALYRQLGLDQPPVLQYLYWLIGNDYVQVDTDGDGKTDSPGARLGLLRGDFGSSIQYRRPVLELILERIPATLLLSLTALVVGYLARHRPWPIRCHTATKLA